MLKGFSAMAVQYVLNLYAMYVWVFFNDSRGLCAGMVQSEFHFK